MKGSRLALFIIFASITIPEYATGSTALTSIITDPGEFFLFSLPALLGLYGCGVILIREAAIKWKKGWPTILAMGVAYGIMEEGISVHTFFAPVDNTVGIFGIYGKFMGLNVTWAVLICLVHAVYSISLPILLSNLLWPESKEQRLLTRKTGALTFFLYGLTVALLFLYAPYKPSVGWVAVLLIVAGLLVYISKHLDLTLFRKERIYSGRNTRYYFLAGLLYFPFLIVFPRYVTFFPSVVTDALLALGGLALYRFFERKLPGNDNRKLAVMAVALILPLQFFGVILNFSTNPLEILAVIALFYVEYRVLKVTRMTDINSIGGASLT